MLVIDCSETTLNYRMMWRDTQFSRKRLAVRIPTVKSPLYLTEICQVINYLLCFGVGLSAFYLKNK
jgi:hypothetical protein